MIDVEHVHEVITRLGDGQILKRGEGKTTSLIYLAVELCVAISESNMHNVAVRYKPTNNQKDFKRFTQIIQSIVDDEFYDVNVEFKYDYSYVEINGVKLYYYFDNDRYTLGLPTIIEIDDSLECDRYGRKIVNIPAAHSHSQEEQEILNQFCWFDNPMDKSNVKYISDPRKDSKINIITNVIDAWDEVNVWWR